VVEETVAGRLVLNQPAGHLEPDETLPQAALRETREETGWDVRLTGFVGAYQWTAPAMAGGPHATTCGSRSAPSRSGTIRRGRSMPESPARCG
jgi:8-oxo-dGTP pyrophosphatase MutT (NUDIX family)